MSPEQAWGLRPTPASGELKRLPCGNRGTGPSRGNWARLVSKPFVLQTPELTASVDARFGEVRFQITNVKSEPIAGLTFEDCQPLRGVDELETPIRWNNASLASCVNQPLRLEIKFHNANLYGLRSGWRFLDAQGIGMLDDCKSIDHLLTF